MNDAIENLVTAQKKAMSVRPKVGGFPYLAEILRQAGVRKNIWSLPSCSCIYLTDKGPVVSASDPLLLGNAHVPDFDQETLIAAIRKDQKGESEFREFLSAAWSAGVIGYTVDLEARNVTYQGVDGEKYVEDYPQVDVPKT